jgi:hypothetical protein
MAVAWPISKSYDEAIRDLESSAGRSKAAGKARMTPAVENTDINQPPDLTGFYTEARQVQFPSRVLQTHPFLLFTCIRRIP